MTENYVNLCKNQQIQHTILITTPVTHDTQLEWYACTQLVRSWYAASQPWYALVRTVWYALERTGTHLVRILYASSTHPVRSCLVRILLIWYASDMQLVRSWYTAGHFGTHLVRTNLVSMVRICYA